MLSLFLWQPPGNGGEHAEFQEADQEEMVSTDLQIHELLEALRESRLVKALDLSQERAKAVLEKVRAARKIRKEYIVQRYRIENQLDVLLRLSDENQGQIDEVLKELETVKHEYFQRITRADQELRDLLTPAEEAKYVLFQRRFNQELREIIASIREQSQKGSSQQNQLLRQQEDESVIRQTH